MSATKILWGQLIVVGLIVIAFVWAATQWTAWRLGYQPQLGAPWFELWRGMPVYAPPAFFWWWFHFDAYERTSRRVTGYAWPRECCAQPEHH